MKIGAFKQLVQQQKKKIRKDGLNYKEMINLTSKTPYFIILKK